MISSSVFRVSDRSAYECPWIVGLGPTNRESRVVAGGGGLELCSDRCGWEELLAPGGAIRAEDRTRWRWGLGGHASGWLGGSSRAGR